jgi:hypothetical protein
MGDKQVVAIGASGIAPAAPRVRAGLSRFARVRQRMNNEYTLSPT